MYGIQGEGGVVVSVEGEVGDGFIIIEVGAGEHEEVAQHAVAVPVRRQLREAVEDVERALSELLDDAEYLGDEVLEAGLGVKLVDVLARSLGDDHLVIGEAEVDEVLPSLASLQAEGAHEAHVILDVVHLVDYVVTEYDPIEYLI